MEDSQSSLAHSTASPPRPMASASPSPPAHSTDSTVRSTASSVSTSPARSTASPARSAASPARSTASPPFLIASTPPDDPPIDIHRHLREKASRIDAYMDANDHRRAKAHCLLALSDPHLPHRYRLRLNYTLYTIADEARSLCQADRHLTAAISALAKMEERHPGSRTLAELRANVDVVRAELDREMKEAGLDPRTAADTPTMDEMLAWLRLSGELEGDEEINPVGLAMVSRRDL